MMTSSLEKTSFTRTEKTEQTYPLRANKSIESLHGIASDKKKNSLSGQLLCTFPPTSCKSSSNFSTLLKSSSKIPCRLSLQSSATSWKHPNKLLPFRRSTSLRLRNSKSNCTNRVKMAENGIALAGANCTDGSETGNGQVVSSISRRKLKSLTRPATRNEQPLKRSLSLRKNFKISSSSLNKTESLKQQQTQKSSRQRFNSKPVFGTIFSFPYLQCRVNRLSFSETEHSIRVAEREIKTTTNRAFDFLNSALRGLWDTPYSIYL
uniref:Uncharacterized protein n=1 Tax=Glossina pallidipes TaxID=7398 RepID=A0A1A9Z0D1_GLOPL